MSRTLAVLLAGLVVLAYLPLATLPDLRLAVPMLLAVAAVVTALLGLAALLAQHGRLRWSPALILTLAAGLRLLFLFRPPELSDDVFRYLWDGLWLLHGHNP